MSWGEAAKATSTPSTEEKLRLPIAVTEEVVVGRRFVQEGLGCTKRPERPEEEQQESRSGCTCAVAKSCGRFAWCYSQE